MSFVEINPRYEELLQSQGLVRAEDFLQLGGLICSGHPDRNVARVLLGEDDRAIQAFLKREHRVRFKERWRNALAGFGFVSKSIREWDFLQLLDEAGIDCPEAIAAGEHRDQAFLLIREVNEVSDLRTVLVAEQEATKRRELARQLGKAVACVHNRGFIHRDLFAKHILVQDENRLVFLDWQRSHRNASSNSSRLRDFAYLDASLAEDVATDDERLLCLQSYLEEFSDEEQLSDRAQQIRKVSTSLLNKRHVRDTRRPPLEAGKQNLIWLDGEALVVTKEFLEGVRGEVPSWLPIEERSSDFSATTSVGWHDSRRAQLTKRRKTRFFHSLVAWLRCRRLVSKELEQAVTIFRLQRHEVPTLQLLAFGQKSSRWHQYSLLLTDEDTSIDLREALSSTQNRSRLLRAIGRTLRRIHESGYRLRNGCDYADVLGVDASAKPVLNVRAPGKLSRTRSHCIALLNSEMPGLDSLHLTRADRFRIIRGYFPSDKKTRRQLLRKSLDASLKTRRTDSAASPQPRLLARIAEGVGSIWSGWRRQTVCEKG